MKTRLLSTFLLLVLAACQRGGSATAIPATALPTTTRSQDATPTYNIVTLVAPSATPAELQAQVENSPTALLAPSPTAEATEEPAVERPLLIPRLLQAEYTAQATRLVIGFEIHPAFRSKPGVFGEVYDATLTDQAGREIAGVSVEIREPEKSILEFEPLPSDVISLTLRAQLALRGVPAQAPLVIDVSGRPLERPWPIQTQVRFGDVAVKLHTARLSRAEIGAPPQAKQQLSLELWGENAKLNGAQLICISLAPSPPQSEGGMSCGQEPDGSYMGVALGPVIDRDAPLPMPTGLVTLKATADFLLPGVWETTFSVEK